MCIYCINLKNIDEINIYNCDAITSLQKMNNFKTKKLYLSNLPNLSRFPFNLPKVEFLTLAYLNITVSLSENYTQLKYLKIIECNIDYLPETYINLETLYLKPLYSITSYCCKGSILTSTVLNTPSIPT